MRKLLDIAFDRSGGGAAEFALVLPALLFFLIGMVDVGRFLWEYNQAEKATQMGVRYAVATALAPGQDFADFSFAVDGGIPQGNPVPTSAFSSVTCSQSACECVGGAICSEVALDSDAFTDVVSRMQAMYPPIGPENVLLEYRHVGLGYAGDPNGPDVAPLVTVRLQGLQFVPFTLMMFGGDLDMPDFRAALTLEDGSGDTAN